MISPTTLIPPNDPARVAALERYEILDTPGEATFDIITSMLAEMLQVPHACVSLVDRDRVWFKSTVGVEVREVDREAGFCSTLVVSDEDVRHIEDAKDHPGTQNNSLVCGEPGIRFYAGAPLCTPDGYRIGTLCAFGPMPRGISDTERSTLRNLATLVMHEIELRSTRRELERTEAALRKAQKLESIGMVASGVAHDFNNLLSGILGNAQLLRRKLVGNATGQELVNQIETTGRRAADLAEQVLAYAGRGEDSPIAPTDLNALVRETHRMVLASLEGRTNIVLDLAPDLPAALGQSTGLRQLVLNLLTNAAEACGPSGETRLTTAFDPLNTQVVLTVSDQGRGIAEEAQARIFEPFFSSKAGGRGLGLAICHRIVEQHAGTIEVESEIGQGTTFRVTLPACEVTLAERAAEALAPESRLLGRVLVVDDEPSICDLAERALAEEGYEVLIARGGAEALDILDQQHGSLDVILLDWRMPLVDGEQVLAAMVQRGKPVPVILASGHPQEHVLKRVQSNLVSSFLKKPFMLDDLLDRVEQAREHQVA